MDNKDNKIKKLIIKLAHAISNSVYKTNSIQDILDEINEEGYEIDIVLAARLDLYQKEIQSSCLKSSAYRELKFEFDKSDIDFLKRLHIKLED